MKEIEHVVTYSAFKHIFLQLSWPCAQKIKQDALKTDEAVDMTGSHAPDARRNNSTTQSTGGCVKGRGDLDDLRNKRAFAPAVYRTPIHIPYSLYRLRCRLQVAKNFNFVINISYGGSRGPDLIPGATKFYDK
jgi:hypothetical protein